MRYSIYKFVYQTRWISIATAIALVVGWLSLAARSSPTIAAVEAATATRIDVTADDEQSSQGRQTFQDNCLMCHSEELASSQRLTSKQWAAEVDKMIGWGAPVQAEQKVSLVDYLFSRHSDGTAPAAPDRSSLAQLLETVRPEPALPKAELGDAARGGALYATNCASCHGADARGADLGTNLVGRPVLLRAHDFREVLRQGLRRMPGFVMALTPAQEADIRAWLLQQHIVLESKR
jgi:quinol---cytochrome-c reductase cytochrome c subunit